MGIYTSAAPHCRKKMLNELVRKANSRQAEFLTRDETFKAILWPTYGFWGKAFHNPGYSAEGVFISASALPHRVSIIVTNKQSASVALVCNSKRRRLPEADDFFLHWSFVVFHQTTPLGQDQLCKYNKITDVIFILLSVPISQLTQFSIAATVHGQKNKQKTSQ